MFFCGFCEYFQASILLNSSRCLLHKSRTLSLSLILSLFMKYMFLSECKLVFFNLLLLVATNLCYSFFKSAFVVFWFLTILQNWQLHLMQFFITDKKKYEPNTYKIFLIRVFKCMWVIICNEKELAIFLFFFNHFAGAHFFNLFRYAL